MEEPYYSLFITQGYQAGGIGKKRKRDLNKDVFLTAAMFEDRRDLFCMIIKPISFVLLSYMAMMSYDAVFSSVNFW